MKSKRITVQDSLRSNNNTKITVLLFWFAIATYIKITKQSHFVKYTIAKYLKIDFCDITCTEQKLICKHLTTKLLNHDHR